MGEFWKPQRTQRTQRIGEGKRWGFKTSRKVREVRKVLKWLPTLHQEIFALFAAFAAKNQLKRVMSRREFFEAAKNAKDAKNRWRNKMTVQEAGNAVILSEMNH